MASDRQIAANRRNAEKSTGPKTRCGKDRSRRNAVRHGLTARTVIDVLENAADYRAFAADIMSEYNPRTSVERELVFRLASVLWRLRRSTNIETGLFQIEAELMRNADTAVSRRRNAPPEWTDDLDIKASVPSIPLSTVDVYDSDQQQCGETAQRLAACFLQVSRLGDGAFELLHRYETALWRQAAQLLFMLQSDRR